MKTKQSGELLKMAEKIIILSGKQYSGKDTVAKILLENLTNYKRIGLGDAIKIEYSELSGVTFEEIEKNNAKYIMWDFSNLSFLDSSGIGLILGRYNEIRRLGGACGIMGLTGATRKIIQMTGLFGIIEEYRSLAAFKKKVRINI